MKPLALVVENDPGTRKLLEVLLNRFGLEVDVVASASDAILLLAEVDYDLILLELLFPGATGLDVIGWLESNRPDAIRRTAIVTSAPQVQISRVRAISPSIRVIRKPFELSEVMTLIRSAAEGPTHRTGSAMEEFSRRAVRAGAKAAVIVGLHGTMVDVVDAFGYPPGALDGFLSLKIDTPVPICAAMRSAQPLWLASIAMAAPDYPTLVPVWAKNESRALATVPIHEGGKVVGAAGYSFREPRMFHEAERQAFVSLAELAAEVLRERSSNRATGA